MVKYKPFNSNNGFTIEVYNELTILAVSYLLMVNIELIPDASIRYNIGWIAIGIIVLSFVINTMNVLVDTVIQIKNLAIKIYRFLCKKSRKETTVPMQPTTQIT